MVQVVGGEDFLLTRPHDSHRSLAVTHLHHTIPVHAGQLSGAVPHARAGMADCSRIRAILQAPPGGEGGRLVRGSVGEQAEGDAQE